MDHADLKLPTASTVAAGMALKMRGSGPEMGLLSGIDGSATHHGVVYVMGVAHLAVISHHGWVDAQASMAAGSNKAS
ncbi:hypothetical protein ACLOJK_024099 [Asimina triloba]